MDPEDGGCKVVVRKVRSATQDSSGRLEQRKSNITMRTR